ncbi:MAG TPA: lipocalin family protein [Vicinamibacterales bacterium]|nr:lipocalin family protein [Vicinamibacterales bacterium]
MSPRVLLTGASGYIGSRLLRELEARGCTVRCLARQPARVGASLATTEVVTGDCLDAASLDAAMEGVDQAYYLVHSMASGASFAALDREAATNFGRAARRAGVRRIIYLGGLADAGESLSTHLKSRVETGEALRESGVPVVEFRASIVIGAGCLSFEMIRALVERLPAMICPRWVDTRTQPIAIDDVLAYLRAALELPEGRKGVFEIGGPEVVSYGAMMRAYAELRGLLRRIAQRAVRDTAPRNLSRFSYSSVIGAPAVEVFRWHEQPGALAALTSAALVRIEQQEGGIRDNARVTVSIGVGRARVRWSMRHYGYVEGRRFCDEQVAGPFAVWRHVHLFESLGPSRTLYEDRIEFAVARRGALNRLAAAALRPVLQIAFAHRHRVVRTAIARARRRVAPRWAAAVALVAATTLQVTAAPAQGPPPVRAVPFVDLDRYAGDWFEIARFPNRFQRQCLGDVRATYARRPDGRVDVVNRCRTPEGETEARGVARIVDDRTFAKLKVRFAPAWLSWLPIVWGDYWIIGLAPDYSWAVVGDPGRDYLWILARAPHLDDASTALARAAARQNGFDVERLVATSHAGASRHDAEGRQDRVPDRQ